MHVHLNLFQTRAVTTTPSTSGHNSIRTILHLISSSIIYSSNFNISPSTMPPPRSPPSIFPTNPLLSYPLFETYRLSAHPSQSDVSTFPLPTSYHAARPQSAATGYKETKKRVEWNSMYDGTREDEFLWVDNEWNVVLGTLKVGRTSRVGPGCIISSS